MSATEHLYEVSVNWLADRKGIMTSPELINSLEVVTPPQFPKGVEGIWSPEHLLVAAVNSCLMTTFLAIAENSKLEYESFNSKAIGKLEMVEGKFMMSEIVLNPVVHIISEQQKDRAERVLHKSEVNCLISNSIKSKIIFQPEVIVNQAA